MSSWIKMMPVEGARGFLKEMFDKVMTPSGTVDNVMRVHSLRPQSMNAITPCIKACSTMGI